MPALIPVHLTVEQGAYYTAGGIKALFIGVLMTIKDDVGAGFPRFLGTACDIGVITEGHDVGPAKEILAVTTPTSATQRQNACKPLIFG